MNNFFVHESSYIDDDVIIGSNTKIWHFSHVLKGAIIGKDCSFGQNTNIGNNVTIGDRCKIQNNVSIYEGVEIGSDVFCGPSMVFTNYMNPRPKYSKGHSGYLKTIVRDGVSIGANATIVCGNELGEWCLIAAGAVITKDVLPHALMAGVPAKRIGWVCECGNRLGDDLQCSCGRKYVETEKGLVEKK